MGNISTKKQEINDKKLEALRLMTESRKRYLEKILEKDEFDGSTIQKDSEKESSLSEDEKMLVNIDIKNYDYPFENLVLEGGGTKGMAYFGSVQVLKECNILKNIKRFAGTSAGALVAILLAVDCSLEEVVNTIGPEISACVSEGSLVNFIPNMCKDYGWNPGFKFYDVVGQLLAEKTNGNPDITFLEFYELTGKELCIVATNVNSMQEEYFHVKTTPNVPMRLATRMSIAIPGVFEAVTFTSNGETNTYVDGGLTCNFPIHCFDGWWLSMNQNDSILERLSPLDQIPKLMNRQERFKFDPNYKKTLGLLVYAEDENDVHRYELERRKIKEVAYPDTKLSREKKETMIAKEKSKKENKLVQKAVEDFLAAIDKSNLDGDDKISRSELEQALKGAGLPPTSFKLLFGEETTLNTLFEVMDTDGNGAIDYNELQNFIESIGISIQNRIVGYNRVAINSMMSFFGSLQNSLMENTKRLYFGGKDIKRSIGINTGYVGSTDWPLSEQDYQFLTQRSRDAMEEFLKNYVTENNLPKRK